MKFAEWKKRKKWPKESSANHFADDESNVRELVLSITGEISPENMACALGCLEEELTEAFGPESVWHDYARMHWSK